MALILDDDGFLDAADGFAGWDDALVDDTLAQELEQERTAELESELEQDERPIDYDAELEDAEEEAAPTSEKRLKRELRAEALRRLEDAARTAEDFARCGGGMEQARPQPGAQGTGSRKPAR